MLASLLSKISPYSVLLVGDRIIDEYVYVKPQGKSPKEHIVTYLRTDREAFEGGVIAASRHVRGMGCFVELWHGGRCATVKRRYVEPDSMRKVCEVHERHTFDVCPPEPDFSAYDVVIVTDFGHGLITAPLIERMTNEAAFLAVNAQTNSSNHGFNLITKYPRADYVVLDELEARLAAHDRDSPIEDVIVKLDFHRIIVTLGPRGSIGYHRGEFARAAAVSDKIIDTMGAGDAFFCVTAPLAAAGADIETLCKVGNAAGAIKCGVVGHRQAVTREALLHSLGEAVMPFSAVAV